MRVENENISKLMNLGGEGGKTLQMQLLGLVVKILKVEEIKLVAC